MLTWLRRLIGPAPDPPPRLVTVVNRCDELEARVDYLADELKALRGRVVGKIRKEKVAEDAPGETNGDEVPPEVPPSPTAHLARRFRRF